MARIRAHRTWMTRTGQGSKVLKLWRAYHGMDEAGGSTAWLSKGGKDGSLVKVTVNGVRPVVQALLSMAMANRPAMLPVASNSDAAAREAADLSKGVIEHFHRVHRREEVDKETAETGLAMSAGYTVIEWDAGAGEPVAADPENPDVPGLMSGDLKYDTLTPFDVYWNPREKNFRRRLWTAIRRYESKWEVAARFPEKAEQLLSLKGDDRAGEDREFVDIRWADDRLDGEDDDLIPIYTFWHKDCAALPGGRQVLFCGEDIVLTDGPMPYDTQPVFRVVPGKVLGTSHGYTSAFDALGVGDVANGLYSAASTNNSRFGVPVILGPKGSGLHYQHLATGGAYLEYNPVNGLKPEVMNFTKTAPELFDFIDRLAEIQRQAMGMNATAMGNPAFAGMAASLAALMDAKAQAFNDGLQQDLNAYYQDTATHELQVLKRFATDERVAVIAGKSKNWMLKKFTGDMLGPVERIAVEPVAAASRTLSGKMAVVELLAQMGQPMPPKDVVNLLNTGELDSGFEAQQTTSLRIKAENEGLLEGKPHQVLISDPHWLDIPEHLSVLSNPAVREDPQLVQAVLDVVQEHLTQWQQMPPELLQAMGGPPPPMAAPMVGPDGMPLPPDAAGMPTEAAGAAPMPPPPGAPPQGGPNPFAPEGGPEELPGLPPLPPGATPPPNGVA